MTIPADIVASIPDPIGTGSTIAYGSRDTDHEMSEQAATPDLLE